jgi:transposase
VKKILRGYRREETSRFIAFRSHWRFQSEFCNPARGNEKGGVEGEGGYFRRNHWVPLPQARDLEELNAYLDSAVARISSAFWRAAARPSERPCSMSSRICCR